MSGKWCGVFGIVVLLSSAVVSAAQSSPGTVTYQGVLTQNGQPIADGAYTLTFTVYDAASGGGVVETVAVPGVQTVHGRFAALVPVSPSTFNGSDRWWSVTFNGTELPRQRVTAAPYAIGLNGLRKDEFGRFGIGFGSDQESLLAPLHIRRGGYDAWLNPDHGHLRLEGTDDWYWTKLTFGRSGTSGPTAAIGVASFSYGSVMAFGTSNNYAAGITNSALAIDHLGRVVIGGGSATTNDTLHVHGNARVNALVITGGADIAEHFPSAPGQPCAPAPGMVMTIDPVHAGSLRVSTEAYDTRVAGVYSGANGLDTGMIVGQDGCRFTASNEGRVPLAMTGRVWVFASDESGEIKPGDRLTSSGTKHGYAMKVKDESRAPGAVIGKAMTGIDPRTGMVLVLVNLQ